MKRISREARKLAEEGMPRFAEAVRKAALVRHRIGTAAPVPVTLAEFGGDFMLLYACLWYAASCDVAVTVLPKRKGG